MSSAFDFPPIALSKPARAALEDGLQALADAATAGTKYENEAAKTQKRRDALEAEVRELESADESHAAAASARLPALREELALIARRANRPPENADATRSALDGLSATLASLLRDYFLEIEAAWFSDVQKLYHSLPCTAPSVRLNQFPGYQTLVRCLLVDPKNWPAVVDENLAKQADYVSGIARDMLDRKNPFAWIAISPRRPE